MKRLIPYLLMLILLISCTKKDTTGNMPDEGENMVLYSYYTIPDSYPYLSSYPSNICPIIDAECYFYKAEDIQPSMQKEILEIDNFLDYPKIHSEVVSLLEKDGKLKLSDGTFAIPITIDIRKYDKSQPFGFSFYPSNRVFTYIDNLEDKNNYDELSRNEFALKPGKYFVVAICNGYDSPYGYYYSDKYSGKFITVSSNMPSEDRYIKIVFPYDDKRKGYFDWIDATWDF